MKPGQKKEVEAPAIDILSIIAFALYCSLGISTFLLAPLPMIAAHGRFQDPWPKVVAILGAVIAVSFMQAPLMGVVISFIFGLVVSDSVSKKISFWKTLGYGVGATIVVGAGFAFITAQSNGLTVWAYWQQLVNSFFVLLKESAAETNQQVDWVILQKTILFEGPFLLVSGLILSLWLSLGLAAYLRWFHNHHPMRASQLRKIEMPWIVNLIFIVLFIRVGTLDKGNIWAHVLGGVSSILGTLLMIQGMGLVSSFMNRRKVVKPMRGLVYLTSILLGFYVLVGLGLLAPIYRRREKNIKFGGNYESHSETESRKIG